MGFIQAYRMAIKSIISNKIRAFLTMLGVIIGVGAVIAAVAFAQGSTKSMTDQIQSLGTNLIQVMIVGRGTNRDLTYTQLQAFANKNTDCISELAPQISGNNSNVKYGDKNENTSSVIGTTAEYGDIKSVQISEGRFLTDLDVSYYQKIAVIGTAVISEIFPSGTDPIGKTIKVNNEEFTVVGILQETANSQAQSADDQIIIPISVAQLLFKNANIRSFMVEATSTDAVDVAMAKINAYLMQVYLNNTKMFRVISSEQMLSTLNSLTGTMMAILGGIATISLIVGGIGIMNIMLVSVTERTREIGIRKAIGAKKSSILIQFLIEAVVVTGMGGVLGVIFGASIIKFIIGGLKIVPAVYSLPWTLLSFSISLVIGVVFGLFPAYKAAKLNPIEALRFE